MTADGPQVGMAEAFDFLRAGGLTRTRRRSRTFQAGPTDRRATTLVNDLSSCPVMVPLVGRGQSTRAVRVATVLDADDDHLSWHVVDAIEHPVRPTTC